MAGPQQALESPFAQQPSDVVDENPFMKIQAEQAKAAPQEQVEVAPAAPTDGVAPEDMPTQVNPFEQIQQQIEPGEPERGFITSQLPDIGNLKARVRASFGRTENERMSILQSNYGEENVRMYKGKMQVKLPGREKFSTLDPETFDVLGDLFADNARDIFVGTGAFGGFMAGGGPASPATALAGGAAAGAASDAFAEQYAENVLGMKRDPSRGGVPKDDSLTEQGRAIIERTLDHAETGVLASLGEGIGAGIGAKLASRSATKRALKAIDDIPVSETVKGSVGKTVAMHDELLQAGLTREVFPNSGLSVPAHHLLPESPEANIIAKSLKNHTRFQKLERMAVRNMETTTDEVLTSAMGLPRGSFLEAAQTGLPTKDRINIQGRVGSFLKNMRKKEGIIIGRFRAKAGEAARGLPVKNTNTIKAMDEIFNDMGIQVSRDGRMKFPDMDEMSQLLGVGDERIIRGFQRDLEKLFNNFATGGQSIGFDIDALIAQSKIMGGKNAAAGRIGGLYKRYIGKLSSSLRRDTMDSVQGVLSGEDAITYAKSIEQFRNSIDAQEQLSNLLRHNSMASNSFVKGLMSKGRDGLANLQATKKVLLEDSPKLWNDIVGEFMEQAFIGARKSTDPNKVFEYDAGKIRKMFFGPQGFGKEYLDELIPKGPGGKSGARRIAHILDLSDQMERQLIKGSDDEVEKTAKTMFLATSQFVSAKLNAAYALYKFGSADKRMLKLLSRKGVDHFIEDVPKAQRGAMREMLQYMVDNGVKRPAMATLRTGKEATKRAAVGGFAREGDMLNEGAE